MCIPGVAPAPRPCLTLPCHSSRSVSSCRPPVFFTTPVHPARPINYPPFSILSQSTAAHQSSHLITMALPVAGLHICAAAHGFVGLYPASCDDPTVSYVSNAASSAPWDIISNSTKDERPSHDVHFLFVLSAVVNSCFVTCRGSASSSEHLARQHRRRAGPSTRQRPSSVRHRLSR
jgi:hypothetical protein